MHRILLVIPCYRERRRLPVFFDALCSALAEARLPVDVLAVDDGSGDAEARFLERLVSGSRGQWPFVRPALLLERNRGKGGAVYAGWDTAVPGDDTLLAFVDADGAVSSTEIVRVLRRVAACPQPAAHAWFAVRTGTGGTTVQRTLVRRLTGRVFATLVRILFRMPLPDTQCGFKVVPQGWFQASRTQLKEERFCFDIEMAYWLLHRGISIEPVPISWRETPGSHLGFKHVLQMFASLLDLRRRLG